MNIRPEVEQLDAQRQALLGRIEGWSPARLAFQPAPESWSAMGILDHLARTETEIVRTARAGVSSPHRIGVRDRLGVRFIESVFRSDRRVKVPGSVTAILPGPSPELSAILEQWDGAGGASPNLATRSRRNWSAAASSATQSAAG